MAEAANIYIDNDNRKWPVVFSTATLRRLREDIKFALDEVFSPNVEEKAAKLEVDKYNAFLNDDLRFAEVLYTILKPDLEKAGVSQTQFEEGLTGEGNVRAIKAFHAAFETFSRAPRKTILRGITITMQKQEKLTEIGQKRLEKEAAKLDDKKLEQLVNEKVDAALKDSALSGAAS